jgi:hypothetical protein
MKTSLKAFGALGILTAAITLTALVFQSHAQAKPEPALQAVFLDSGAVFFGRLEGVGSSYPVLSNAFYVQSVMNPETKQSTTVLVKRGREWHGPDRMTISAQHILFIEPVTAGSQVAHLMEQAK